MRLAKLVRHVAVVLALAGMLGSNLMPARAGETAGAKTGTAVDVALGQGGILRGQVVDAQGIHQAQTEVTLQNDKGDVARATTDKDGFFHVQGLRPGLYVVTTKSSQGLLRAWTPEAAPPAAIQNVLLVSDPTAVRGNFGFLGLGALLIIGGAVAIGVAVATQGS